MIRIGIDVGGTKIEGIALDGSREVARTRVNTPRDDYAATLEEIVDVVAEIAARAASGDRTAEQTTASYERRMAKALASVINLLDPDVIVLGGGLSNIERLYANAPRLWGAFVFAAGAADAAVRTRLVRAAHGDSSGVRGAAWLWA